MYNYSKLLGKMREKGYTQEALASEIGVSASTLNKKLKQKSQFTQDEITNTLVALGEPLNSIPAYFFAH